MFYVVPTNKFQAVPDNIEINQLTIAGRAFINDGKNPTKDAIEREIEGLQSEVTKNDNVIIFYAGHGAYLDNESKNLELQMKVKINWFEISFIRLNI